MANTGDFGPPNSSPTLDTRAMIQYNTGFGFNGNRMWSARDTTRTAPSYDYAIFYGRSYDKKPVVVYFGRDTPNAFSFVGDTVPVPKNWIFV